MNTGLLASRYSSALIQLLDETGNGEAVLRQVEKLLAALDALPDFRKLVADRKSLSSAGKLSLFEAALDGEPMASELRSFLRLLMRNGRIGDCRLFLTAFVRDFHRAEEVRLGRLTLAAPLPGVEERIDSLFERSAGCNLQLETVVDPGIIGGFILEVDDCRLDASLSGRLERIRQQLLDSHGHSSHSGFSGHNSRTPSRHDPDQLDVRD